MDFQHIDGFTWFTYIACAAFVCSLIASIYVGFRDGFPRISRRPTSYNDTFYTDKKK